MTPEREGERLAQHGYDSSGPQHRDRQRAVTIALTVGAAAIGAILAWLFTLSLREVEVLGAFGMCACALALDVRWVIHVRLGYLNWWGRGEHRWRANRREKLRNLTIGEGVLALVLTVTGVYFFANPGGVLQLLAAIVFLVLIFLGVEETRKLIRRPGGPPPGSDMIENCRPVEWMLHPDRIWNGKWGLDSGFEWISRQVPVGHRNKAAALLVVGMVLSTSTQAAALIGRQASRDEGGNQKSREEGRASRSHSDEAPPLPVEAESTLESSEERTYEDNCGTEIVPGDGAPEPLARQLRVAWEELSPADGCAMRARALASGSVYVAEGHCQGRFWSLGIASWRYPAAVLIEDAARAAKEILSDEEILGASPRVDVATGDFHLLFTAAGPYLLVRGQKTDGNGGPASKPESCAEIETGGEKYLMLTPGMAELWLRLNEASLLPVWPTEVGEVDEGRQEFSFHSQGGMEVASGACLTATACSARTENGELVSSSEGVRGTTVRRIVERGFDQVAP